MNTFHVHTVTYSQALNIKFLEIAIVNFLKLRHVLDIHLNFLKDLLQSGNPSKNVSSRQFNNIKKSHHSRKEIQFRSLNRVNNYRN